MATTRSNMGLLELRRTTAPAISIRAPAEESEGVSKPPGVDVAACDFAGDLRGNRLPDSVVLSWPPALSGHAAVTEARLAEMPLQNVRRIAALSCGKDAGIADMVEDAAAVVEPQKESCRQTRCIRHVASDHAIKRSQPSYLDHLTLAWAVRKIAPLGDNPFDATGTE